MSSVRSGQPLLAETDFPGAAETVSDSELTLDTPSARAVYDGTATAKTTGITKDARAINLFICVPPEKAIGII
jgi:hypothetical protein